jgi:hypothetical protein
MSRAFSLCYNCNFDTPPTHLCLLLALSHRGLLSAWHQTHHRPTQLTRPFLADTHLQLYPTRKTSHQTPHPFNATSLRIRPGHERSTSHHPFCNKACPHWEEPPSLSQLNTPLPCGCRCRTSPKVAKVEGRAVSSPAIPSSPIFSISLSSAPSSSPAIFLRCFLFS